MKEKLIKGLKYLKTNAITTTIVLVVLGGGTVLAANFASGTNETVSNTEVATQAETTLVAQEVTTVAETIQEETTVQETQAPTQAPKAVVQEVVTEAPTEKVTEAPKPIFDFIQVDGGYSLSKINDTGSLPSTLEVPSTYNGLPVVAIGDKVLANIPITTFVIPSSITSVGKNLCGSSCDCPTLKAIVCKGETPFSLISFSLNEAQLNGGCTIYVPDNSLTAYQNANWKVVIDSYKKLMKPMSEYK